VPKAFKNRAAAPRVRLIKVKAALRGSCADIATPDGDKEHSHG
jgi:hypothetical protein